ncbi:MAG TPA: dephospho-CoA kinase [Streptosporangiaceae bacterium]|nr:dephospho-CoA kinase [Streptosporangiaceae bacterium]
MLRVGLTGGIGAGKSEVSRRLASHGAVVIDADVLAREVVAPGTPGLNEVTATFGPGVLRPDGSLDRERLGALVFSDPAALAKLNAIVHPLVGARATELQQAAADAAVVVHDIPLLAENNLAGHYDVVVVVDVPPQTQVERLVSRGMTAEQARARMAAQASREQRLAVATVVVDNSGDLADLDQRVENLWQDLVRRSA